MKPILFLAAALVASAALPALADETLPEKPAEAIPDNLPRMTAPGPYDEMIRQVQEKLNGLGFDAGTVNGDFGEKTQAALAQFQLANLLPASGALDQATLKELGVERPSEGQAMVGSSGGESQQSQAAD
ncbi:MAG TPA: peptidoglycan-binding domain-containing protein [Burkholderiales bacterium]|nr:peptidoglycan-binding domain-containing protein [Burkholderiales bacterium]